MRRQIDIDNLLLDLENPRLEQAKDQEQALLLMVDNQGDKIYNLAADIVEFGLSPIDTVAVYQCNLEPNLYTVAEGNRRVAALKILRDPNIISIYNPNLFKKFLSLNDHYNRKINKVDCVVFKSSTDHELSHWIELRHMGLQLGKGVSQWDSKQKMRFDKKKKKENRLLDFWNDLESRKILTYEQMVSITITNWERILRRSGLDYLGLSSINGRIILPQGENFSLFTKKIKLIQKELAHKTVSIVYGKKEIEEFFKNIDNMLNEQEKINYQLVLDQNEGKAHPTPEEPIDYAKDKLEGIDTSDKYTIEDLQNSKVPSDSTKNKVPTTIFNNDKTIIPTKLKIISDNVRINKIINELKSLEIDKYPNSCGSLLRILFELSAKHYLEKLDGKDHTKDEFEQVIKYTLNDLVKKGLLNKQDHSSLIKELCLIRSLFNGYMHNTNSYPSSESIKSIFKAHHKFIILCLE